MSKLHAMFAERIRQVIDADRVLTGRNDRLAHGTDASFYRLVPEVVIQAETMAEITATLREASALDLPVTFRAAGTSLSGQAITDSILVLTAAHWTDLEVLDNGHRIRLQPGVIGKTANDALAPYQRKIGPDPASINAARIGGIVANNASGMCCGTAENSYQTLDALTVVLPDGTTLDSSDPASIEWFRTKRRGLIATIDSLARSTKANAELTDRIRHKYSSKNTMGYGLNALVDFDDPIDIITHLMVGSEGTLGFIGDVVLRTVVDAPHKASALMMFNSIADACDAVTVLRDQPVAAVELMDRASLRSVENTPGVPDYLGELHDNVAALLVEVRDLSADGLDERAANVRRAISHIPTERDYAFTDDPAEFGGYWNIRKGLFPAVGAVRTIGTTVIIEDVAFPVDRLAEATLDLQALFERHGYDEAVIFGHALEGNLHFVFTQDFGDQHEVDRYATFIDELALLVVGTYDGALKAEHGTGRNMAPFLEAEWGHDAVVLMRNIKEVFDPQGLLNPGVILNTSPTAHLEALKPLPAAHDIIDTCIECGFCEPSCLSHHFTYSPRQRIVLQREISRLRRAGDDRAADQMAESIAYGFDQTCATDGLCALACPVGIDTGKYVKHERSLHRETSRLAGGIARHLDRATTVTKVSLRAGHAAARVIGEKRLDTIVSASTSLAGDRTHWVPNMPGAAKKHVLPPQPCGEGVLDVVYFSSCVNRIFGPADDGLSVFDHVVSIMGKADCRLILPSESEKQCCGLAFESQGYTRAAASSRARLIESLRIASNHGEHPVLCDMTPCTAEIVSALADEGIRIFDITNFTTTHLLDRLHFEPSDDTISLFPVCSTKKLGLEGDLRQIGELCANSVHIPETNCCGFAGNRGMLQPELNEWGLRNVEGEMPADVVKGYATSRTCEIGLSTHSGRSFESLVALIDEQTKALAPQPA